MDTAEYQAELDRHRIAGDWGSYFRLQRQWRRGEIAGSPAAEAEADDESDEGAGEIEILQYSAPVDDPAAVGGKPAQVAKRLAGRGFEVTITQAIAILPPVLYATAGDDHEAGDVRTDAKRADTFVLSAVYRDAQTGGVVAVEAIWVKKYPQTPPPLAPKKPTSMVFQAARTYDPYLDFEYRPTLTKPREPNEIEVEEGVEPPAGFMQWLDIFAPAALAATKRKTKKNTEQEDQ